MRAAPIYTNEMLTAKRLQGDVPADGFIRQAFTSPQAREQLRDWLIATTYNYQLSNLPEEYSKSDLFNHASWLPAWANINLIRAGRAFFAMHAEAIMQLLGLLSLPYCYTAADGAMVLYLSNRLGNDTAKRLQETAEFVWDVMAPDAFNEEGKGFVSILKVRLMHAAGRYYTLANPAWRAYYGTPINQEDMAGTNLSFSLIVIRGLRKLGFAIQQDDQQAFLHLWNVIGYLLGLHDSLLPETSAHAQDLEAAIRLRQFRSSEQGRHLTASLTDVFLNGANRGSFDKNELLGLMRYLGDEVSGHLGIQAPMLSASKIRFLTGINLLNDLKPKGNAVTAFYAAHSEFKRTPI